MSIGHNSGRDLSFYSAARLSTAFYEWEQRGRGWRVWPHAVDLEPPFRQFEYPQQQSLPVPDDARKPTLFSGLLDRWFGHTPVQTAESAATAEPKPTPSTAFAIATIQVALAPDVKVTADIAEHFLLSLSTCRDQVSYEIVGTSEAITVQFACSEEDADHVIEQIRAHFPDAVCSATDDALDDRDYLLTKSGVLVVDFGLSEEFMRPLRTLARFDADPLIAVTGALSDLREGEIAALQVLFRAVRAPWSAHTLQAVIGWKGEGFFADAPELIGLAKQKVERPLFATAIRVIASSAADGQPDGERQLQIAKRIGGALAQLAHPTSNQLIALSNDDYPQYEHVEDVVTRQTHRSGALLNSEELVTLVHPPSTAVRSQRLARGHRRTKAAPKELAREGFVLGENSHNSSSRRVALTEEQRLRHSHVIGASGTGKSTLLVSLIAQDVTLGNGCCVLDPHGDLIDEVLCRIPEERTKDVLLIDPADIENPVGFNILSAHSELEKTLLASDLVAIFRRLSTTWGDQMSAILANAVLAFLESSQGGTLADLRRFLVEADYRNEFLGTVQDRDVVYFWQKEFPLLTGRPQGPLLTRIDAFLRPKLIRNMVAQRTAPDFASIMNEGGFF